MSPSNLHGLNIVHPVQHSGDNLQPSQVYPDLAAQLDLWTNLAFDSDEPLSPRQEEHKNATRSITEEEEESRSPVSGEKAVHDGHVNVVTPANVPETPNPNHSVAAQSASLFDINSFLDSLGIDAFTAHTSQLHQQHATITPSPSQLLVLHPSYIQEFVAGPRYNVDAMAPLTLTPPALSEEPKVPRSKRPRTRSVSVTSTESPSASDEISPSTLNLRPIEDKRRRNTAASARFRLKKKEREAALEGKAKELETKATELKKECRDLRRENEWLKGLLVGATGAVQVPTTGTVPTVSSPPPLTTTTTESNRRREEPAA